MKLAIVGSRDIVELDLDYWVNNYYDLSLITEIVSGGARGVDALAKEFALRKGIPIKEFLPDYQRYGRGAPVRRNYLIAQHCDFMLAFPRKGGGGGTGIAIEQARALKKKVVVVDATRQVPAF